jgi:type IV pilus assembly protein PilN
MARINLLPWRAERRKQRQREFNAMLGFAFLVGAALFGLWLMHVNALIDVENQKISYLNEEIRLVDIKLKEIEKLEETKRNLLARKEIIEELQANRSQMVHLFDDLVKTIPEGVQLTSIKQEGTVLTLQGVAQSNARVSTYMRNFEQSEWLGDPDLSIITATERPAAAPGTPGRPIRQAANRLEFTLKVNLKSKNQAEEGPENTATAGATAP